MRGCEFEPGSKVINFFHAQLNYEILTAHKNWNAEN